MEPSQHQCTPESDGERSILTLIPLDRAADWIGIRPNTLRQYLARHRSAFPPIYRVDQGCKRRLRYLTNHEVEEIRQRYDRM